MGLAKKVVFIYENKAVKGLIVEPGQKMWKIHVATHKVEEIELPYDTTRVDFDMAYYYLPAINKDVALTKFKRDQQAEEAQKKKYKLN